ncbi:MAG: hypothetical protein J6D08_04500 [Lachnospiraceae bacterium]|nr:hypothetical protein [Lachnospiraceae bacterium]
MGLTQLQKLELNKRVDKILHAPANALIRGQQLEIAFAADFSGDIQYVCSSIKDAATSLKAHDKIFQNVRSNMVYWNYNQITTKVTPMSFIQMGRAFENKQENIGVDDRTSEKAEAAAITDRKPDNKTICVDNYPKIDVLCEYLKLYHARCRCILVFTDRPYEEFAKQTFDTADIEKTIQGLNPFLKYRLLVITRDKMLSGSEWMMKLTQSRNQTKKN